MIPLRAYAIALAAIAGCWWLHSSGYKAGEAVGAAKVATLRAQYATQLADAQAKAIAQQDASAKRIADIAAQHEQDKKDAQAKYDRTLADIRAGNLRLRKQWRCPSGAAVPASAASAGKPDAEAGLREKNASDLVRIAAGCDSQIERLQALVRSDRK